MATKADRDRERKPGHPAAPFYAAPVDRYDYDYDLREPALLEEVAADRKWREDNPRPCDDDSDLEEIGSMLSCIGILISLAFAIWGTF